MENNKNVNDEKPMIRVVFRSSSITIVGWPATTLVTLLLTALVIRVPIDAKAIEAIGSFLS